MKTTKAKRWIIAVIVVSLLVAFRFTRLVDDHLGYAATSAAWSGNMLKLRLTRLLGVDIHKPLLRGPLLVSAAEGGQREVVAYLLAAGVDIEAKDKYGRTALHEAAVYGHIETVRMLIKAGANVNPQDREGGNTPLDLCRRYCRGEGIDPAPIDAVLVKAGGKAVTTKE